jgi:hypothetical protein
VLLCFNGSRKRLPPAVTFTGIEVPTRGVTVLWFLKGTLGGGNRGTDLSDRMSLHFLFRWVKSHLLVRHNWLARRARATARIRGFLGDEVIHAA